MLANRPARDQYLAIGTTIRGQGRSCAQTHSSQLSGG